MLVEGLAGIHDDGTLFDEVTISPRFAAAQLNSAEACVRDGPSRAYVALGYRHHPAERLICLRLAGVAKKANLRVLLPKEATSCAFSLRPAFAAAWKPSNSRGISFSSCRRRWHRIARCGFNTNGPSEDGTISRENSRESTAPRKRLDSRLSSGSG